MSQTGRVNQSTAISHQAIFADVMLVSSAKFVVVLIMMQSLAHNNSWLAKLGLVYDLRMRQIQAIHIHTKIKLGVSFQVIWMYTPHDTNTQHANMCVNTMCTKSITEVHLRPTGKGYMGYDLPFVGSLRYNPGLFQQIFLNTSTIISEQKQLTLYKA